jgi:hypothetical protein
MSNANFFSSDQENVIVKMTRHEGDLHHPDILRKLLQYDT